MERRYRYIKNGMDIVYYIYTPENYDRTKKYPLIVALHGAGTYGSDPTVLETSPQANAYRSQKPECVMLQPFSPYETWSSQQRNLKTLIDIVCDKYNIDTDRVSICGGSMGGFGTWDMITENPDFFSAAAPICGGGMGWQAPRIGNMPIRIYHGDKDGTVIPERSVEMFNALKAVNPENDEITLTLLENVEHNAWDYAYADDEHLFDWLISKKRRAYDVYVSGEKSGISRYRLENGKMTFVETYPCDGVMYMQIKRGKLYAILRNLLTPLEGGVLTLDINKSRLVNPSAVTPAYGKATCHLIVDNDENVYMVNYLTGNVVKVNPSNGTAMLSYHKGDSVNKPRQDKEHTHQLCFTPDGKYITVCDLGTDTIHIYDLDLVEVSTASAAAGSGPRHIVFSDCGKYAYCINELSNTVTVYEYSDGTLSRLDSYDMLPFGHDGLTTAAAIRICGKYLYTSTRGHDSISRFEITDGGKTLKYIDNTSVEGLRPRDFNISPDGKSLICANEGGEGSVTLFDINSDGSLTYTGTHFTQAGALCVIFN